MSVYSSDIVLPTEQQNGEYTSQNQNQAYWNVNAKVTVGRDQLGLNYYQMHCLSFAQQICHQKASKTRNAS
jgi:hypothetical protein